MTLGIFICILFVLVMFFSIMMIFSNKQLELDDMGYIIFTYLLIIYLSTNITSRAKEHSIQKQLIEKEIGYITLDENYKREFIIKSKDDIINEYKESTNN